MIRQRAIRLLRQTHLLPLVEQARFQALRLRHAAENARVRRDNPGFAYPPLDIVYDAHGSVSLAGYRESGHYVAGFIHGLAAEFLDGGPDSIGEWGCGPGRIIRHMRDVSGKPGLRAVGSDYNPRSIAWAQRSLAEAEFVLNGLRPPLPLEDDSLDCLYATSVYTHLSEELHFAWFLDNVRVVRPGGIILFTTHGDAFRPKLLPEEQARYDAGELVVRGSVKEGSRIFVAFHAPAFIRDRLIPGSGCELLRHAPSPDPKVMGGQDVWAVRVV